MNIAEKIEECGGIAAAITEVNIRDENAADPMARGVGGTYAGDPWRLGCPKGEGLIFRSDDWIVKLLRRVRFT